MGLLQRIFGASVSVKPQAKQQPKINLSLNEPQVQIAENGDTYFPIYQSTKYLDGSTRDKCVGYHLLPRFMPWASVKATFPTKESNR